MATHVRRPAPCFCILLIYGCLLPAHPLPPAGSSILIRSYTWPELRSSLPWLIGSLGTVALDAAIFVQWRTLGHGGGGGPKDHPSDEESPLLDPDV